MVYRDLTGPGSALVRTLAEAFGPQIVRPDGSLDRPALASIVFSDPVALQHLDHLTHPAIVEEVMRRIEVATSPIVATDGIKLIESGMADACDEVWVVTCDPARQRERLIARNGYSTEEADRRIAAQPPIESKLERADVVIPNVGTFDDLRVAVRSAWNDSLARARDRGYSTTQPPEPATNDA
jgi:dephospho-CoA kinase